MNINGINASTSVMDSTGIGNGGAGMAPPSAENVQSFNKIMSGATESGKPGSCSQQPGQENTQQGDQQQLLKELLAMIQQIIQQLAKSINGEAGNSGPQGGSTPAGEGGGIKPVDGGGPGGSTSGDGGSKIPKPTEHIQQLNLGGKPVTIGGDGTASAAEVQSTAANIQNLYENSPTFRNMIDSSSDPSFEVSVGRRSDNTSWGNDNGRVFMNINSVPPTNNDTFQALLGHEFAHASVGMDHGPQIESVEDAVAREA